MTLGLLSGKLISVDEVIREPKFDGHHVALHGLLYLGDECLSGEFLCLSKPGSFNGEDPGIVKISDRSRVIMISDPKLESNFKKIPAASGTYLHKYDAVLVGRVRRERVLEYNVLLTDLWAAVLQEVIPMPNNPYYCQFHILAFSGDTVPSVPWSGLDFGSGVPIIESEPS